MTKTVDNYWLATSGPYTFPTSVQVTSILGDTITDVVNVASPTGAVAGGAQFPLSTAYGVVGGMLPAFASIHVRVSCLTAWYQSSKHAKRSLTSLSAASCSGY